MFRLAISYRERVPFEQKALTGIERHVVNSVHQDRYSLPGSVTRPAIAFLCVLAKSKAACSTRASSSVSATQWHLTDRRAQVVPLNEPVACVGVADGLNWLEEAVKSTASGSLGVVAATQVSRSTHTPPHGCDAT